MDGPRPADLGYTPGSRRSPAAGSLRGIVVQNLTPGIRQQLGIASDVHGVVVTNVDPDNPAAEHLEQGDGILSVNRHDVDSAADFNNLATEVKGQALLRIIHHGEALFVVTPADQGDR